MALFERDALTDGTQVTVPRYLQEGASLVGFSEDISDASEETIISVTTGKVLYVTDIVFQVTASSGTANDYGFLEDGNGGTVKMRLDATAYTGGEVVPFRFSTPLKFENAIYWAVGNPSISMSAILTISGWEEDA